VTTTIPPIIPNDAKWRQLEDIQPGHWVLMEYEHNETGERTSVWSQVVMRLSLEDRVQKRKIEELRGADAEGYRWDFRQLRGFQMLSLTEAQGRKAGLEVPGKSADQEDGGTETGGNAA
jgi:hypothetical protein